MFHRLRNKIIFSFCLLMVGGGVLSTSLVSRNLSRTMGAAVDRNGRSQAQVLADQLMEPLAYGDRLSTRRLLTGASESDPDLIYAFVTGSEGRVLHHSFPVDGFPSDLIQIAGSDWPETLRTETGRVRDLPYPIAEGELGTLHVGISMAWVDTATGDAVENVLATTVIALAIGILGILVLAELITRPVLALRDAAMRFGTGETDAEVKVDGTDEIADLAGAFNQMAAQVRARIEESDALREYVERVLDQMESSIFVVSEDRQVEYANRVAATLHGDLWDQPCWSVMHEHRPCQDCPVPEVLETGSVIKRLFESPAGRTYELKWLPVLGRDGNPAVVERALDITERREIRERLHRAQRLALAGEISAGVVHSVNNPLDGVRRALDLAAARPRDLARTERMLALAREGTDRIADITRTLLGFARGDETRDPVPVDVEALVETAVGLARLRAESKGVVIDDAVGPGLPSVWMDPQSMEEVLVNLLLNAVDACGTEGLVRVRARAHGGSLEISVDDSGPGIPSDQALEVFEPFFTTKETEKGTGLGLSVARRAVEAHGGELALDQSELGGARFVAHIPLRAELTPPEKPIG